MDRNNVVPIDQSTERVLAHRQRGFRWLVGVLTAAWMASMIGAVALTPLPPLAPFAILAVLVILAEHRFVLFGDETSMSGSMIVIVASVFVFADTSPVAGPILIASLGGLYLPHLRNRAWGRLAFNMASFGISACVTVGLVELLRSSEADDPTSISLAATAALGYWVVNNLIVAGHQKTVRARPFVRAAIDLTLSDLAVPFLAGLTGLFIIAAGRSALLEYGIIALAAVAYSFAGVRRYDIAAPLTTRMNSVEPLAIWAALCTVAHLYDALDAQMIALIFITALLAPRVCQRDFSLEGATLLTLGASCAFLGWPLILVFGLFWVSYLKRSSRSKSLYANASIFGVAATSLVLHALRGTTVLPTAAEVAVAALSPWTLGAIGCAIVVAIRTRPAPLLMSIGLGVPSRAEFVMAGAIALIAFVLASHPTLALASGSIVLTLWCYARFRFLERTVHASR